MTEAWFGFACGAVLLFAGTTWLARLIGGAAAGAGWLVRGPVAVAAAGATAVLATSLTASLRGSPGVEVLGSVIGSAVATVALGLGIAAVGHPLRGSLPLLYRQLPAMMAASGLVWFLSGDSRLSQADGAVLVGAFVVWAALSARPIRAVTPSSRSHPSHPSPGHSSCWRSSSSSSVRCFSSARSGPPIAARPQRVANRADADRSRGGGPDAGRARPRRVGRPRRRGPRHGRAREHHKRLARVGGRVRGAAVRAPRPGGVSRAPGARAQRGVSGAGVAARPPREPLRRGDVGRGLRRAGGVAARGVPDRVTDVKRRSPPGVTGGPRVVPK